ncbi:MAG: hypothetical protein Q4F18_08350, partial [Clostridia bacterium]|nr:hypothetical protein [Clostridia bacterium]
MKFLLRIFAPVLLILCTLALTCGAASANEAVNCYWLLESIETETSSSDRYGPAQAKTDIAPADGLDAAGMTEAVRGVRSLTLDVTRLSGGFNAHADYTFSGIPAAVPGAASARLTITAATRSEARSFYLYASIFVNSHRVLRVRDTGAWVQRVFFPRKAVPGDTQTIELCAREAHDLASVHITYVYRAYAGVMLVDANGDVVLYDADGRETGRIAQTVEDILPVFSTATPQSSKTIFSAEEQTDGSLIATFDPHSGLSEDELIRLLRAASQAHSDASPETTSEPLVQADASSENASEPQTHA